MIVKIFNLILLYFVLIDFYNVEDLVFSNQSIRDQLPDHSDVFSQWFKSKSYGNKSKINQLKINFLNNVTNQDINKISFYFGENIFIKKISNNITKNIDFFLHDDEINLDFNFNNFCLYRNKEKVYLTFWR